VHVNLLRGLAWCASCPALKPTAAFAKRGTGTAATCRACKSAYDKTRYNDNAQVRSDAVARAARQRAEQPAKTRATTLKSYYKRAEYYRLENREWRKTHKDVMRAHAVAWVAANPQRRRDVSRNYAHRRRAQIRGSTVRLITVDDVIARCEVFGNACAYCRRPFGAQLKMTIDHVIPLSRGGPHILSNLRPACAPCNYSKRAKLLSEWEMPCY